LHSTSLQKLFALNKQPQILTGSILGFIWVGSIMNSLIVFLPGNVIGKFGIHLKESYFLNVPYVIFPLVFAIREFRKASPAKQIDQKLGGRKVARRCGFLSIIDLILIMWLLFAIGLAFFRAVIVQGTPLGISNWWVNNYEPILLDESKWPRLQMMAYAYYFVPFYICAILCLLYPNGKTWFPDWVALHTGAALQAQFSYIFPAVHQIPTAPSTYPNQIWVPVPASGETIFWGVNLSLVVVPLLLFLRVCCVNQSYWSTLDDSKIKKL